MNHNITQWAIRHGVSHVALDELRSMFVSPETDVKRFLPGASEAAVVNNVRLEASRVGALLTRNNVGACMDKRGRLIRYGLFNDSKQMNEQIKSPDLIGIKPVLITQSHVGSVIGQFLARECKEGSWQFKATAHENAQLRCLELFASLGGDACFVNGEGSL
tara:strand:+ start:2275 stop:2757 length:483 start_codon:yes stop_codon:yes gene_type:complete